MIESTTPVTSATPAAAPSRFRNAYIVAGAALVGAVVAAVAVYKTREDEETDDFPS